MTTTRTTHTNITGQQVEVRTVVAASATFSYGYNGWKFYTARNGTEFAFLETASVADQQRRAAEAERLEAIRSGRTSDVGV